MNDLERDQQAAGGILGELNLAFAEMDRECRTMIIAGFLRDFAAASTDDSMEAFAGTWLHQRVHP